MTRLTAIRLFRLSQSCQAQVEGAVARRRRRRASSRASSSPSVASARCSPSAVRRMPTSCHMQSNSASRIGSRSPAGRANGASCAATLAAIAASSGARQPSSRAHPRGHAVAGDAAEHGRVGDAVAAEAVGAVHAAGVLAGGEQPVQRGAAVGREDDAAHHVVGGRHDLDRARRRDRSRSRRSARPCP